MRAPAFWWRTAPSLASSLLSPVSLVYNAVASRRLRRKGEIAALPVICIGNFTAGGAGKTPTAIAIAEFLAVSGETPAFLSRGYGGTEIGPTRVTPSHTARDVGDEPCLLARFGPTIVSRDRPAGARLALDIGATVIVMDDGLQNPSLGKDLAIAVVDGATGTGNGLTIPAGPLRAAMGAQWPIVDAVIVIGDGVAGERVARDAKLAGKAVFTARLVPDPASLLLVQGSRVLAFAGIGRPEKFYTTLQEAGVIIEEARSFPDHHAYSPDDIAALKQIAETRNLRPVTTEKDLTRISGQTGISEWPALLTLGVDLVLDQADEFRDLLRRRIADRRDSAQSR